MFRSFVFTAFSIVFSMNAHAESQPTGQSPLDNYIDERLRESDQIPPDRQQELRTVAEAITTAKENGGFARLNFICTHNSRRSHLAQIWFAIASSRFGVDRIEAYSGGTEATAMNSRIVASLERTGMKVDRQPSEDSTNPHYRVQVCNDGKSLDCFSKIYDQAPNPKENFIAVLVCGNADKSCPVVSGSTDRLLVRYQDPKVSDGTEAEAATYDERCRQIAREMLFVAKQLASSNR